MTGSKDQDGQSKSKNLLSASQVAGGALASVTAAYLGSRLGVAGTFWGAGLSSVIISVGGAVYQRSLEGAKDRATITAAKTALTRAKRQSLAITLRPVKSDAGTDAAAAKELSTEDLDRLRRARSTLEFAPVDPAQQATRKIHPVPGAVRPGMHWPGGDHVVDHQEAGDAAEPTIRIESADAPGETEEPSAERRGTSPEPATEPATELIEKDALPTERSNRIRWAAVAATSAVVFVVCVVLVTGFEGITGKPLSGGPQGTSLGRMMHPNPPNPPIPTGQPVATTSERPSSQVSGPTATWQPSEPPSVVETSNVPPPPSPTPSSQQVAPTSSAPPVTTTSTVPQAPESLLPSQ